MDLHNILTGVTLVLALFALAGGGATLARSFQTPGEKEAPIRIITTLIVVVSLVVTYSIVRAHLA